MGKQYKYEMKQEQKNFQAALRELVALAKEKGTLTEEQLDNFFEEQGLDEAQREMVAEYLAAERVDVIGCGKKKAAQQIPLSPEEEQFLKRYREELPTAEELTAEEEEAYLGRIAGGDEMAKLTLLTIWLHRLPEIAREVYDGSTMISDLVQEGSVSLLLALESLAQESSIKESSIKESSIKESSAKENAAKESLAKEKLASKSKTEMLREEITNGMRDLQEETRSVKHRDNVMVQKVNRLQEAIEELSDGEELDFSVAELSAYLDMSVEEIEDLLRLTGEET